MTATTFRKEFLEELSKAAENDKQLTLKQCLKFSQSLVNYCRLFKLNTEKDRRHFVDRLFLNANKETIKKSICQVYKNLGRNGSALIAGMYASTEQLYDFLYILSGVRYFIDVFGFLASGNADMEQDEYEMKHIFHYLYLTECDDDEDYPEQPLPYFGDIPKTHFWWRDVAEFMETEDDLKTELRKRKSDNPSDETKPKKVRNDTDNLPSSPEIWANQNPLLLSSHDDQREDITLESANSIYTDLGHDTNFKNHIRSLRTALLL